VNKKSILSGFLSLILLSMFLAIFCSVPSHAAMSEDDWPMSRHDPAHSGYSVSSAPATPFVIWSYPNQSLTEQPVYTTPVVSEGFLYTRSAVCLNASTGLMIWSNPDFSSSFTPAVSDGYVYLGISGLLVALNASSGAKIWRTYFTNIYGNQETGGSPTVTDGVAYLQGYHVLHALNASTGIQLWEYPNAGSSGTSIVPAVVDGYVYAATYDYIYALKASTGEEVWTYPVRQQGASSPAVYDGKVIVGAHEGVYSLNARTGALVWNYTTGSVVSASPAVAYGMVYVGSWDHNIYALDASTGDKVWNFTTEAGVHSSVAVADGVVYASSDDCYLYALNASTGTLIWKFLTISPSSDLYSPHGNMIASPIVANGNIYIGTDEGNFLAFGNIPESSPTPVPSEPVENPILSIVVASVAVVVLVGAGLLVYFKKRKR
jgi:outer membrane protein assembly factor BamB